MNGAEHYAEAENLATWADNLYADGNDATGHANMQALVHATLAVAAAITQIDRDPDGLNRDIRAAIEGALRGESDGANDLYETRTGALQLRYTADLLGPTAPATADVLRAWAGEWERLDREQG